LINHEVLIFHDYVTDENILADRFQSADAIRADASKLNSDNFTKIVYIHRGPKSSFFETQLAL